MGPRPQVTALWPPSPTFLLCQFIEKSLPPIKQVTMLGILLNKHVMRDSFQIPGGRIITPIVQMRKLSLEEVELPEILVS